MRYKKLPNKFELAKQAAGPMGFVVKVCLQMYRFIALKYQICINVMH